MVGIIPDFIILGVIIITKMRRKRAFEYGSPFHALHSFENIFSPKAIIYDQNPETFQKTDLEK